MSAANSDANAHHLAAMLGVDIEHARRIAANLPSVETEAAGDARNPDQSHPDAITSAESLVELARSLGVVR